MGKLLFFIFVENSDSIKGCGGKRKDDGFTFWAHLTKRK